MSFGEKLQKLRKEKNITQREFAEIFNISKSTISMWEIDKNQPDMETILKLASFFDISTDYLLGLEDEYGNKTKSEKKLIRIPVPARGGKNEILELTEEEVSKLKKQLDDVVKGINTAQSGKKKKTAQEDELLAEYQKVSKEGPIYDNNILKIKENDVYFSEKDKKNK